MDERLTYKIGKNEFVKFPCVGECAIAECPKQFTPVPPEDGKTFCLAYPKPADKWIGLNPMTGKPKKCPVVYKPEFEEAHKLNPVKASRRGIKSLVSVAVAAATGSKESGKKKTERRDSR